MELSPQPLSQTGKEELPPSPHGRGAGGGVRLLSLCLLAVLIALPLLLPGAEGSAGAAIRGADLASEHRLRSAVLEYQRMAGCPGAAVAGGLRLGRIYLQLGSWQEAVETFRSVDAREASQEVNLGLAMALDRLGETRSSLEILRRELELRPSRAESWSRLVEMAAGSGLTPDEIDGLLAGLPRPEAGGAAGQRASYLLAACLLGPESADGGQALQRALSGPDADIRDKAFELLLAANQQAVTTAGSVGISPVRPYLSTDPQPASPTAHLRSIALARVLLTQGLTGPALAYLKKVPAEGAQGAGALALEGYGLMKLARLEDARAVIRRSLELEPDQTLGQYLMGSLLLSRGDAVEAVRPLERAARRDSGNPAILLELGRALAEAGDFSNAGQAVAMAVEAAPDDWGVRLAAARFHVDRQYRVGAALPEAREAVRLSGRNPEALATLGWANHLVGNSEDALKLLSEAVARDPKSALLRYRLASVHEALGQPEQAREQYLMVWELDGSGHHWKRAQAALEGL